jgi:hypothetical protein
MSKHIHTFDASFSMVRDREHIVLDFIAPKRFPLVENMWIRAFTHPKPVIDNSHPNSCPQTKILEGGTKDDIRIFNLPLPNEDFGKSDDHLRMRFQSTFQGREYSIWDTKR